jgi:hypothetical protein
VGKDYPCCPYWKHYDTETDLLEMIANGLIWRCSPRAQERAVRAIIAGEAELNERVPPQIAEWIRAQAAP